MVSEELNETFSHQNIRGEDDNHRGVKAFAEKIFNRGSGSRYRQKRGQENYF